MSWASLSTPSRSSQKNVPEERLWSMSSRVAVTVSPSRVRVPCIDRFCRVSLRFVGMAPLDPQRNRRSVDAGQLFSVVVAILHVLVGGELNAHHYRKQLTRID